MIEQSETCPEQGRRIQNRKSKMARDSAECAGAGGQSNQITEVRDQKSEIGKAGRTSMTKRIIFLTLCSLLLAPCCAVEAQQPAKVPRIGFQLDTSASAIMARIEGFRQGLRELRIH